MNKTVPPLNRRRFERSLGRALARLLNLMRQEWGHAPSLEVHVEPAVLVRVGFNIKGFAHKARSLIVHARNVNRHRKPHLVAREIAAEISSHRNTCADCGAGIAPIWSRARDYGGTHDVHWDTDAKGRRVKVRNARNVLPDGVEQLLHPVMSNRARRRIMTLPEDQRQTAADAMRSREVCPVKEYA